MSFIQRYLPGTKAGNGTVGGATSTAAAPKPDNTAEKPAAPAAKPSTNAGPLEEKPVARPPVEKPVARQEDDVEVKEQACCLAWALTKASQARITAQNLKSLHSELVTCAELVGAMAVEICATHGVFRCDERTLNDHVSPVDTMVRLGQLICRWATEQDPEVSLRVGVHLGELQRIVLPSGYQGSFGSAVSVAQQLAESAPVDRCVHLLPVTKQGLRIFERIPMSVAWGLAGAPSSSSYYLEPWVEALDDQEESDDEGDSGRNSGRKLRLTNSNSGTVTDLGKSLAPESGQLGEMISKMSLSEFSVFLVKYGVETSKFGKGQAKSLASFYREMTEQKKSYLFERNGKLERRLELVRISLCARDPQGIDRCLMLSMEILDDGRTRARNQKLASVVPEGISWQEAIRKNFQEKFNLPDDLQRETLSIEANWFKEEKDVSPSIPGIPTTYLSHEVRIRVVDTTRSELNVIGLPSMRNFTTCHDYDKDSQQNWTWAAFGEENNNAESLTKLLQDHHINVSEFDKGAFEELLEEVYETKASTLMIRNSELLRHLQIIRVSLTSEILSVPMVLVTLSKVQKGRKDDKVKDRPISIRMKNGQSWQDALPNALIQRLGLDRRFQEQTIQPDMSSYRLCEEIEYSRSYPGLKTVYRIHEITCRVVNAHSLLGLPEGHDFSFTRVTPGAKKGEDDVVMTTYTWRPIKDLFAKRGTFSRTLTDATPKDETKKAKVDPKRRLKAPEPLALPQGKYVSEMTLGRLMKGLTADWERAKNAARRIRDSDYNCKMFYDDCVAAFPELKLYMGIKGMDDTATTSSGRSADDEYQRTMGALFAVYWLMRLSGDGAQSFAFGVSDEWDPLLPASKNPRRDKHEQDKRAIFLDGVDWGLFEKVLVAAGMLKMTEDGKVSDQHDEERTLAMLALTAIHDIMKVQAILPTVEPRIREFCGYKAGDVITDHDVALGYILEHHPDMLPSFDGLPKHQRDSVKFTQCTMEYNMGWLVQAEAPPGALFRKFKSIISTGSAKPEDIAFYFTHWLTDLAGAEPFPLEGCEKFVLKFPQKVLVTFLNSFPFVQHLSVRSETEVFEEYLLWRWKMAEPSLGNAPSGPGSVARMRLMIMAGPKILDAFDTLSPEDQTVLADELARTGVQDQTYERDCVGRNMGPSFLGYYFPALLSKNSSSDPVGALTVIAEVLRKARNLWPLEESDCNDCVTVQVDALKELDVCAMLQLAPGEYWALRRVSSKSATVMKLSLMVSATATTTTVFEVDWNNQRILSFASPVTREETVKVFGEEETIVGPAAHSLDLLPAPLLTEVSVTGGPCVNWCMVGPLTCI